MKIFHLKLFRLNLLELSEPSKIKIGLKYKKSSLHRLPKIRVYIIAQFP